MEKRSRNTLIIIIIIIIIIICYSELNSTEFPQRKLYTIIV